MAILVVLGASWIVWMIQGPLGRGPTGASLVLLALLGLTVLPFALVLAAVWVLWRSPPLDDQCPRCHHALLAEQTTCPECGGTRSPLELRSLSARLQRARATRGLFVVSAIVFQQLILFAALLIAALLLVPTGRMVTKERGKSEASGRVFRVKAPEGAFDRPYNLSSRVTSHVLTMSSFAAPVPYLRSEVGLEVTIDGAFTAERDSQPIGHPHPISIARLVRSRSDLDALVAEMTGHMDALSIPRNRDPMRSEYDNFGMVAAGFWSSANSPNAGAIPPALQADRWQSIGAVEPAHIVLGIPVAVGLLAYVIARPPSRTRGRGDADQKKGPRSEAGATL